MMNVGDLVKVEIESGHKDIGLIVKKVFSELGFIYEVRCEKSQKDCVATEDMLEVINEAG